jgi:hypothetical protein
MVKDGKMEPEQTSIAKERLSNYISAARNSNERVVSRQQAAKQTFP